MVILQKFTVGLLNKYHLFIPKEIFKPFAEEKQSRVKLIASFEAKSIEFYAAVKQDKNTGDYKFMFSKQKQKALGVFINDYLELQIFKDTSKYGVDIHEKFKAVLLSDYDAYELFEKLTAGKKRSIIYFILRIKNSQNRIDKALILCENLKRGVTEPKQYFNGN